jgi:hypothetical protein
MYYKCKHCSFFMWVDTFEEVANKSLRKELEELRAENALLRRQMQEAALLRAQVKELKKESSEYKDATTTLVKAIGKIVLND